MGTSQGFFHKQQTHSKIKTQIVTEYFKAWAGIMLKRATCPTLTYLDLFSGPGLYDDGTRSTPMIILDIVQKTADLRARLKICFCEGNRSTYQRLCQNLESHPVYHEMAFKPDVRNIKIREDVVAELPVDDCTFTFIDPYGYKELDIQLLTSVITNWGSDSLVYFSTSGIRRNIVKKQQWDRLSDLLGSANLDDLSLELKRKAPTLVKDRIILECLKKNVTALQGRQVYFLPFAFEFENMKQQSHWLVFMCKHYLGFKIMKDIMGGKSFRDVADMPLYLYSPVRNRNSDHPQLSCSDAMEKLKEQIICEFCGRSIKVDELMKACHQAGNIYPEKNIKNALILLENEGRIEVSPPAQRRPKDKNGNATLGAKVTITFSDIER